MKKQLIYPFIFLLSITSISCNKDEIIEDPVLSESNAKQITSFVFLSEEHDSLVGDIIAVIDESSKTIEAFVPFGTEITTLNPVIQVSEKASISPIGARDFSSQVNYTVTAEDGSSVVYKATVTVGPSNAKQILSFMFKASENETLANDIPAIINEDNKTISATVFSNAEPSTLIPDIEISPNASLSPEGPQDFTQPVIYSVTAENGSTIDYTVTLTIELTEKDALIAIYNANPDNTLGWGLNEQDVNNWVGVTTNQDGKVIDLAFNSKNLKVLPGIIKFLPRLKKLNLYHNQLTMLPSEMKYLEELTFLSIGNNDFIKIPDIVWELGNLNNLDLSLLNLTTLPKEILQLIRLETLNLSYNHLTVLPDYFSELDNLQKLLLISNQISDFPKEVFHLKKLNYLNLRFNNLTTFPSDIVQLINLESLYLGDNHIRVLPSFIKELNKLEILSLRFNDLASISKEIGKLNSLKVLYLNDNELYAIPAEMGNLKNLTQLDLSNNDLAAVPAQVCKLEDTGTNIIIDPEVTCQ